MGEVLRIAAAIALIAEIRARGRGLRLFCVGSALADAAGSAASWRDRENR
jgi:hypothetical protein